MLFWYLFGNGVLWSVMAGVILAEVMTPPVSWWSLIWVVLAVAWAGVGMLAWYGSQLEEPAGRRRV